MACSLNDMYAVFLLGSGRHAAASPASKPAGWTQAPDLRLPLPRHVQELLAIRPGQHVQVRRAAGHRVVILRS